MGIENASTGQVREAWGRGLRTEGLSLRGDGREVWGEATRCVWAGPREMARLSLGR